MLNVKDKGNFYVRIQEYAPFPEIEGRICLLRDINAEGLIISFMANEGCIPGDGKFNLPSDVNDNGWYNITNMMLAANVAITPRYDNCVFDNDTALNYRNYLDSVHRPLDDMQAKGKICLLGTPNGRVMSFSKQAYYVIDIDEQGYALVYAGFCQPLEEWEKPKLSLRVLRLVGTGKKFYEAAPIVAACNGAYHEDMGTAQNFVAVVKETASTCSTETNIGEEVFSRGISKLRLG